MASTYSNLKIQLMTTGENTTTWGNVTNVNLGTAIEEAVTGSADVAFSSAHVTLTLTDTNSTQSARNLRLNLTGTATSGYNLVVPAIEKVYIINNGTDGTITVKNATGTGIAVPTGKTMWVFNNGTNVVDVSTHLTSLTLATALPATSGGTGTNVVTYCNLQSNVAGILPIANGGTGASTAAAARTALGSTTAVDSFFTLANPSAITFPSINANNTVSALDAASFRAAIGAGTGSGTVTSVAAITLGTTGTDLSSTVATGTTTPVITLQVPTASATNRGALSSANWSTFNSKAASGANTDITALDQDITITATGTIAADTIGYRGLPQLTKTASYTLALADAGKHISITTGGVVIPANGTIAFPIGTTVVVYNDSGTSQNITITTDNLLLAAGTGVSGTRALAGYGLATLVKAKSTTWVASGAGLT